MKIKDNDQRDGVQCAKWVLKLKSQRFKNQRLEASTWQSK